MCIHLSRFSLRMAASNGNFAVYFINCPAFYLVQIQPTGGIKYAHFLQNNNRSINYNFEQP